MLEWALMIGLAAAGAAGASARSASRRRAYREAWVAPLEAVADRHDGRASARSVTPSLRATIEGSTVTLTIFDAHRGPTARAEADVSLPNSDHLVRLHLGWDTLEPPQAMAHVGQVDPPPGLTGGPLEGLVELRADDPAAGRSFVEAAALDLVDVRRETLSNALEVTVRGGYLQLTLHGLRVDEAAIERTIIVAARLARHLGATSAGLGALAS